jgi:hypothetical protein
MQSCIASLITPATGACSLPPADDYRGSEGKKQRRALLGELKGLVPAAATELLVDPVLLGGVMDPPPSVADTGAAQPGDAAVAPLQQAWTFGG